MDGHYLSNTFGPEARERVAAGKYRGWLVSPATRGIPAGVDAGDEWAADNGCFGNRFDPDQFFGLLARFQEYSSRCLFITIPDVVGDCWATVERFFYWHEACSDYPAAFVVQDGTLGGDIPWGLIDALFIGGNDEWKDAWPCLRLVGMARELGKHVHVGRVNTRPRLERFLRAYRRPGDPEYMPGFTYDGTGLRYPGKDDELSPARAILFQKEMDFG